MEEFKSKKERPQEENNILQMRLIIGIVSFLAAVVIIICIVVNTNKFNVMDYITVRYTGADGYATADFEVDKDGLYNRIVGKSKDMEKITAAKKLVNSIEVSTEDDMLKNGKKYTVTIKYDEEASKTAHINMGKEERKIKASGISKGTKISLFDNVEVIFAGISPEAYINIKNNWEDDYLKDLEFKADKVSGISLNDEITVECAATETELARHGYITDKVSAVFKADRLSVYADYSELDKDYLKQLDKKTSEAIVSLTKDSTFRMLYKGTGNTAYLYQQNDETAENIERTGCFFLKKQGKEGNINNYLYFVYSAKVSNSESSEEMYFIFEYSQGYISVDGKFEINQDSLKDRYVVGTDYQSLYDEKIGSKNGVYLIQEVSY